MIYTITKKGSNVVLAAEGKKKVSRPISKMTLQENENDVNVQFPGTNPESGPFKVSEGSTVNGQVCATAADVFEAISNFSDGGGTGEGVTWEGITGKPLHEISTPIDQAQGEIPVYTQGGQLPVGIPEFPENAVPLMLLDTRIPQPPQSGTFVLRCVNGIVSWISQ